MSSNSSELSKSSINDSFDSDLGATLEIEFKRIKNRLDSIERRLNKIESKKKWKMYNVFKQKKIGDEENPMHKKGGTRRSKSSIRKTRRYR
jgi:hypothetical protein